MSFDKILDLTAGVHFIFMIYRGKKCGTDVRKSFSSFRQRGQHIDF